MRLSPGKRKRLEAVSNSRGVIGALAIDQRDALRSLFSAELKIEKSVVPREQLEEFKSIAVRVLSPHASAVLLEPEYGLRAAGQRAPPVGLLMAYEVSGYDPKVPSRLPGLLEHWSVRRLVDAGAHCVKVLLYYALSDAAEIQERKRVWVERVGSECAGCDVPFFLEIVPYQDGLDSRQCDARILKTSLLRGCFESWGACNYGLCRRFLGFFRRVRAHSRGSPRAFSKCRCGNCQAVPVSLCWSQQSRVQ